MKIAFLLLAAAGLAGCSSVDAERPVAIGKASQQTAGIRYEHQLDYVYADGATPFLRLVEVRDP
jgi:hypothetical protein